MADVQAELLRIRRAQGVLTPALVLEDATPPNSPLHDHFTWDDGEAAHRYRLQEAGRLIRSVPVRFVNDDGDQVTIRQWYRVRRDSGRVYEPVEEVMREDISGRILLAEFRRAWLEMQRRYGDLEQFREIIIGGLNGGREAG